MPRQPSRPPLSTSLRAAAAALALAPWTISAAVALVPSGAAATEILSLSGGFAPDPARAPLAAQTSAPAAALVRGCPGAVAEAPALVADLADATEALRLHAIGPGLSALLVEGPDGVLRCAPAGPEGVALVRYERPLSGRYLLWPASVIPGAFAGEALLSETEHDLTAVAAGLPEAVPVALALDAAPAGGVHDLPAEAGLAVALLVAPTMSAETLGPGCAGAVDPSRPDAVIRLSAPEALLHFGAAGDADTTLIVVGPDGFPRCNDDFAGVAAGVTVDDAEAGDWRVWVGLWTLDPAPATLTLERTPPAPPEPQAAPGLALGAPPAAGRRPLPPGEGALTFDLALDPAGEGAAAAALFDGACAGVLTGLRPDAVVALAAPEPRLTLRAAAPGGDATLFVVAPDGTILCNDDHEGADPALEVLDAAAGDWRVWVGLWGGDPLAATLTVDRAPLAPAGAAAAPNPFAGRTLATAADALAIMLEEQGLAAMLAYERLEPLDPEGFVLHGVEIRDPGTDAPPLRIARVTVAELDLEGLAATGAPGRWSLRLEGVDYAALAAASAAAGAPGLPALADAPALDLLFSVLPPPEAPERRALTLALALPGAMAVSLLAEADWTEAALADPEGLAVRLIDLTWTDEGYFGGALRALAVDVEGGLPALLTQAREAVDGMLGGAPAGDPRAVLRAALGARLDDVDRGGVLRVRLVSDGQAPLGDVAQALAEGRLDPAGFSASFAPAER